MKIIIIIITLIISLVILRKKGVSRLLWLMGGVLYIHDFQIHPPFGIHIILIFSFIVSVLREKIFKIEVQKYPFKWVTLILLIIHIMIGLVDDRISLLSGMSRSIMRFSTTYLCFFLGYLSIKKDGDFIYFVNKLVVLLIPIIIWGFITGILQSNPYYDAITSSFGNNVGIWSEVQDRGYRVCSFFSNPIVYGAVMGMFCMFMFIFLQPQYQSTKYLLCACLLINVLMANSRTGLVSTGLLVLLYIILVYGRNVFALLRITIVMTLLLVLAYNMSGSLQSIFDSIIDLYKTGGEHTQGSDVDLKITQMTISLLYFYEKPWFGHGFGFFDEELIGHDKKLAGLEGYIYNLLIEQGVFMIIAVCLFAVWFIYYCLKNKSSFMYRNFTVATFVSFVFFICATGTYGNVFEYFALLLGVNIKMIQLHSSMIYRR